MANEKMAPAPWAKKDPEVEVVSATENVATAEAPVAPAEPAAVEAPAEPAVAPAATPAPAVAEGMVIVHAPKAFKLRLSQDEVIDVKAGVQSMSRTNAEHWYCKANGLTIHEAQ